MSLEVFSASFIKQYGKKRPHTVYVAFHRLCHLAVCRCSAVAYHNIMHFVMFKLFLDTFQPFRKCAIFG